MAETYTSNLGLTKPDYDSPADISVINSNMDKIDNAVANAGKVKSVNDKTGDVTLTAADVGALPSDGTAANATQLNGNSAEFYAARALISDAYDASKTYNSGDYCISEDTLYKCLKDNVTNIEPTNETYWAAVTAGEEISYALKPVYYSYNENITAGANASYGGQFHTVDKDGMYFIAVSCRKADESADPQRIYISVMVDGYKIWAEPGLLTDATMINFANPATAFAVAKLLKGQYFRAAGYNYSVNDLSAIINIAAVKIADY